jgi:chromosome segregation ATPase
MICNCGQDTYNKLIEKNLYIPFNGEIETIIEETDLNDKINEIETNINDLNTKIDSNTDLITESENNLNSKIDNIEVELSDKITENTDSIIELTENLQELSEAVNILPSTTKENIFEEKQHFPKGISYMGTINTIDTQIQNLFDNSNLIVDEPYNIEGELPQIDYYLSVVETPEDEKILKNQPMDV